VFAGDTLSPAGKSLGFQLNKKDAPLGRCAKAGLERLDQRDAELAKENCINSHK
jgi:hypothetical protein